MAVIIDWLLGRNQTRSVCARLCNIFCILNCLISIAICVFVVLGLLASYDLNDKLSDLDRHVENLPHKYAPRYDQPHTTQGDRGTCWAHGLVAGLAHSYRMNGIKKGFLKEDEYVPFSVQAFAISMIKECQKPEYNESVCRELQAGPEVNSTSGGEVAWLYYMPAMFHRFFPLSMCPYIDEDTPESEWKCDPLADAVERDDNPIRFNITHMDTTYTVLDTKKAIYRTELATPYSVDVWMNNHFVPCPSGEGEVTDDYSTLCTLADLERVMCPSDIPKVKADDVCARVELPAYNMEGEFYATTPYQVEGGHCMVIQGWNDEYVTKQGDKGGFPIKNSWYDRVYPFGGSRGGRGSHSLQYLMSEISESEERMICPNAQNPDNWRSCTEMVANQDEEHLDLSFCTNETWMTSEVKWERKAMEFKNAADDTDKNRYFLHTLTHLPNGFLTVKMVKLNEDGTSEIRRYNNVPNGYLGSLYQPIDSQAEILTNDVDNCGLYWMPYVVGDATARDNESWDGGFFDIQWADSSYLINAEGYPQFDYQYLKASQTTRKTWKWDGPIARAKPAPTNPKVDE